MTNTKVAPVYTLLSSTEYGQLLAQSLRLQNVVALS